VIEIGALLAQARVRRGLGLAEAAGGTRLREHYLHAFEQDQFDQLPPGSYLRTYAAFLALDADLFVAPELSPNLGWRSFGMLADELDFVVGVDPHRVAHAIAVVEVRSGVVVFESSVTADSGGYAEALRVAEEHAPGRRAFAIEGTGSCGAGKTDALDAVRAARSVLEQKRPATPRCNGEREALRALMAARDGAVNANERASASCVTCSSPHPRNSGGLSPLLAAQIVLSWSHRGRLVSEAAFARLAGAAPIPASSGQTIRYRLDRSGDRQLNRALQIVLTRRRMHRPTIDYIERRVREGKSRREATRCLKRYLARNLYRLLEHPPLTA
jgi:hypothetical protein